MTTIYNKRIINISEWSAAARMIGRTNRRWRVSLYHQGKAYKIADYNDEHHEDAKEHARRITEALKWQPEEKPGDGRD